MKKLLTIILALSLLLPTIAMADLPDVTAFTDQELRELIDACSAELTKRSTKEDGKVLLLDQAGVTVYQNGEAEISSFTGAIVVPVIIENTLEKRVMVNIEDVMCNGWNCSGICGGALQPKSKMKDNLYLSVADAEIKKLDDVTSLSFRWVLFSPDDISYPYKQPEPEEHRFW